MLLLKSKGDHHRTRLLCRTSPNPGGFFEVTCPDLQSVCQLIAEDKLTEPAYISAAGPISPLDILYGHRPSIREGNLYMAHRCGFTKRVLDGTLRSCGFQMVATWARSVAPYFDIFALASKSARDAPTGGAAFPDQDVTLADSINRQPYRVETR